MLLATVSAPHDRHLTAIVNRLLDEELSQLAGRSSADAPSLSPSARAAVVEIVIRTVERLDQEHPVARRKTRHGKR
ncbi:hypothetical protein [Roseiflexus sp.]|uniref:hypothetical protein n=1 Tax=Roseiflexus sp. TaxID=2562120 RepID=UPI00398A96ED